MEKKEKAALPSDILFNQNTVPIEFKALVPFEQASVKILLSSSSPKSAYQIFMIYVMHRYFDLVYKGVISIPAEYTAKYAQKKKAPVWPGTPKPAISSELYWDALLKKHKTTEVLARFLNKQYAAGIPSYPTIHKLCTDFYLIGWFWKRKSGSKSLFFIPAEIERTIRMQVPEKDLTEFSF